ncbi:hypothetical protein O3M35_005776 [Rhynocoris fuscipes]|uniref:Pro-resilin n=1 Tax=Rhynocoris fuscipes TaxID=488301 RepID=A0AAW1DLS0_9HEMI
MQLHRVMRLEPKQTVKRPVKQEENQKLVVRKRGDQHVKHKNSTLNEQQQHQQQQQYAQMLQQNQHLLYDLQQYNQNQQQQQYGLFQPVVGEQQQADLIQGQYQQVSTTIHLRFQRGEKFEASTKSVPIKVAAARPVDSNDYNAGLQHYRNEHTDNSAAWNNEEDSGEYDFGYRVSDHVNGLEMGKVESKENGLTKGSYHVLLPDGRLQVVNYWSDHTGYHTDIRYISRPH